ncbi:MAG TPA: metallophosphoesterase [Armatimonadaceae bacterium]|nr:metallophosphoesterase [Armatimonadaceae bacterium]
MADPALGEQVTSGFAVSEGTATLYERGAVITGASGEFVVRFTFPSIGVPAIATGSADAAVPWERSAINFEVGSWPVPQAHRAAAEALNGRIGLIPTGGATPATPLIAGTPERLPGVEGESGAVYGVPVTAPLAERQLYDVAVRADDGTWRVVAPHAVYYRSSWHDFGMAHVTDIHVARRIDTFREQLRALERPEGAERLINFNDRFRGFIRYANYLHDFGVLDVILATGDIFDYIFEREDDRNGGGNALFTRQLILGRAPGPDFPDVEELRVPIFLIPGNHDYRKHAYDLLFEVGHDPISKEFTNYEVFNIDREDARRLTFGAGSPIATFPFGFVADRSIDEAARMVEIDKDNRPYREHLAEQTSYVVKLGDHRVVMLDSRWDVGVLTSFGDAVRVITGWIDENEATFSSGSPNSEGVSDEDLERVRAELFAEPPVGLVVVGLHAPLVNLRKTDFPYYVRETQRPALEEEVRNYLLRQDLVLRQHPKWMPPAGAPGPATFIAREDNSDYLDYGVSRGRANPLLRLLAGIGAPRRADVVLHGHVHTHNEVRLAVDGDLRFHFDFYARNPRFYYPTRVGYPESEVTDVEVSPEAPAASEPYDAPAPAKHDKLVQVPPYPDPLDASPDLADWWERHRPLLIQTSALGPRDDGQPGFNGFRVLAVRGDRIAGIEHVPIGRLEASGYRLPWEDAVRPEPPRSHHHTTRSLLHGLPRADGDPFGYYGPAGYENILYRDANNRLFEMWRDASGAPGGASLFGETIAAGDPSVYVDTVARLQVVPFRGTDGHVHSIYWSDGAVGHDALSGPVGAPRAAGNPVGFHGPTDNMHRVVYRDGNDHLITLYWTGQEGVGHEDSTALGSAPAAKGDPSPYFNPSRGETIIPFRGADDHIHSVYWTTGAVGHDRLSQTAGSPRAAGDPCGYYSAYDDCHQIVYRSATDGHVHELWWAGFEPVRSRNLTAMAAAPPAHSDPVAFHSPEAGSKHVVYRSADGHVHEIRWVPGATDPAHTDLSVQSGAAPAAGRPRGFNGPTQRHAVYRGTDGNVHEIRWV